MQDLLGEKRLANLSEESPEVLSPEAFIENDIICARVYSMHANLTNQCVKAIVTENILSIDNN